MKSALFVLVLLRASTSAEIVVQTRPGGTAALKCSLFDSTSSLKWLRGEVHIYGINPRTGMPLRGRGEIAERSRLKYERELEIRPVARGDAGVFTCKVNENEEHHRLVVSSASVSPAGPLDVGSQAELRCDVAGLVEGSVVKWRGPSEQSQDEATVVLNPVSAAHSGSWQCVFSAGGKDMSETVTIHVTDPRPKTTLAPPTTRGTEDKPSSCLDCVNRTASAHPSPGGLGWWVWAAIAGGCLVLLLWVLVLVMYSLISRRRRRFMKMRKAMQLRPKQYCRCPSPTAATSHCRTKPSAPAFRAPVRAAP